MEIRTLQNTSTRELKNCFNASFANYVVPLQLTEEQLLKKFKNDNVALKFSTGVFENNKLVGFIFNGLDSRNGIKMAYNGGTGVLPEFRGRGLTAKMYEFILPKLRQEGIETCVLEVIDSNIPAIKTYEKIGFKKVRELISFKGIPKITSQIPDTIKVNETLFDLKNLQKSCDFEPSWQNSEEAIERSKKNLKIFSIHQKNKISGFVIFNPENGRISQFAVDMENRRMGLGKILFKKVSQHLQQPLTLINIDQQSAASIGFLTKIGLEPFLTQYEMKMEI